MFFESLELVTLLFLGLFVDLFYSSIVSYSLGCCTGKILFLSFVGFLELGIDIIQTNLFPWAVSLCHKSFLDGKGRVIDIELFLRDIREKEYERRKSRRIVESLKVSLDI